MASNQPTDGSDAPDRSRSVRIMFAGSHCLGVFADEIEAIADWRPLAPLPDAPPGVLGVAAIRGRMLTVLAASVLLGDAPVGSPGSPASPPREDGTPGRIVALRGDEQLALAVNQTGEVIEIAPDELETGREVGSLILGVISRPEQSISVLDGTQLYATAMRGRGRRRRRF